MSIRAEDLAHQFQLNCQEGGVASFEALADREPVADSLARQVPVSVAEAADGEEISSQAVRVAPGGKHLAVHRKSNGTFVTTLTEDAPECGCRPAANVLFRSLATACGPQVAALVLTGMGQDGTEGAMAVRRAGGLVLAQDEATSVVWGMPGFVAKAGLADRVLPLPEVAGELMRRCARPTRAVTAAP